MNKYLALTLLLLSFFSYASQRAVTDEGNIVILNSDGTWVYENSTSIRKPGIKINKTHFKKKVESTFSLKSTNNNSVFWIDPKEWTFRKAEDVNQAEYQFQLKGKDLYGMAITEKVVIDLEYFPQLDLEKARQTAPDVKIINQEYRVVNDNDVMYVEMEGTIQGIKANYRGYYYSDSYGSTQYLAYTGANLADQYTKDIEKFLNGFSVKK